MKKIAFLIITLFLIAACGSSEPNTLPDDASNEDVQAGFDDFLKDKQAEDEQKAAEELAKAQERPVTFEKDQRQVKISIPQSLIDDYGQQITECYTGSGSEEKLKAKGEYCVSNLAAQNNEPKICEQVLEGEAKDKCYQALAKEQRDKSYCDKIKSEASKEACHAVVLI